MVGKPLDCNKRRQTKDHNRQCIIDHQDHGLCESFFQNDYFAIPELYYIILVKANALNVWSIQERCPLYVILPADNRCLSFKT